MDHCRCTLLGVLAGCIIAFTLYNLSCIKEKRLVLWLQGIGYITCYHEQLHEQLVQGERE